MHFLEDEHKALTHFFPGLDAMLTRSSLLEREKHGSSSIATFREFGGPALLVASKHGGLGATVVEALRIQRAIGSLSPSLAVATTMHHFSVMTIVEMARTEQDLALLQDIARHKLYVASGFAEGRTDMNILSSYLKVERTEGGLLVSGSKKPCSLSASMNILTASALVPGEQGEADKLAVLVIPADSAGMERRSYWNNWVLSGAESDELLLNNVFVPNEYISYLGESDTIDNVQAKGFIWFELLISASYLGMASALVERVISSKKGMETERTLLAIETESAMSALEGVSQVLAQAVCGEREVARTLLVRYGVQSATARISAHAAELLGGMNFVNSSETTYLLAASRGLAFHPPSRINISASMDKYLAGKSFVIG
ncbi:MAG: acyl-CoA/acyl-ACP dehydrogenase [Blastocatellia bacterium]|nr:acyl-CoA/acyl-ACP dehydrogenase [Blastocatellia bacterium]